MPLTRDFNETLIELLKDPEYRKALALEVIANPLTPDTETKQPMGNEMGKWTETKNGKPRYFRLCAVKTAAGCLRFAMRTLDGYVEIEGGDRVCKVIQWYYLPPD